MPVSPTPSYSAQACQSHFTKMAVQNSLPGSWGFPSLFRKFTSGIFLTIRKLGPKLPTGTPRLGKCQDPVPGGSQRLGWDMATPHGPAGLLSQGRPRRPPTHVCAPTHVRNIFSDNSSTQTWYPWPIKQGLLWKAPPSWTDHNPGAPYQRKANQK